MYLYYLLAAVFSTCFTAEIFDRRQVYDICGGNNGNKFYLEHGVSGTLYADFENNVWHSKNKNRTSNRCTIEFITCPSCVIDINFWFLNISRNCGTPSVFDTCGCDYVWIYEPPVEDASGEQFCGNFIQNNSTELNYVSQTGTVAVAFIYNNDYGLAFSLKYHTKRNSIKLKGHPVYGNMNNASQFIQSPFFPHPYPIDSSVEYFFDWNGQRMYVITGNIFRPPVIISTGPSLVIRFYANGASSLGFKASYSFILGNLDDSRYKPNIACGGHVNNLGGGITMMNMIEEGTTFFDCIWIIKPVESFLHRKTHLYVKVVNFFDFAGTTELEIRQGLTSTQPSVEVLRFPMTHFTSSKQMEHVVPITKGFYVSLRGHFGPQSYLTILFAAFNYKDCFAGTDFLCHNLRCISGVLNCDGFDHCGDDSDELNCSEDPKDRREFSKIPNFLFPKNEPYSDIASATLVFLTCSFGLIGVILAMALLLYRINIRARHQRQIQDHLETIHAILEEGTREVEEEIITSDNPPDYEAPPNYDDIVKLQQSKTIDATKPNNRQWGYGTISKHSAENFPVDATTAEVPIGNQGDSIASSSNQHVKVPDSPPPSYEYVKNNAEGKYSSLPSSQGSPCSHGVEDTSSSAGKTFAINDNTTG
ncbi:hypothetical protein NQ318_020804 [Aromia moschata]|uniref:CUB domain-containing protein n=1 Tax=Aromia moschata TaxID=1265417 RepID=A0AAV8XKG1_9CUCU|nr:hypothetical protein NQ318_020804 [Aromia moschata]